MSTQACLDFSSPPPAETVAARNTKMDAVNALKVLRGFIGPSQLHAVGRGCRGEEKQFFFDKMVELAHIVETMPKTYEQDGKGENTVVYLHYFAGGQASWWITEKDVGTPEEPGQHQAFGLADLFGDGGELGYISIVEILANGGELDFHFTPETLKEIRNE
jgi:hypothetical protein